MKLCRTIMAGVTVVWASAAPAAAAPDWSCLEAPLMADVQHRITYNDAWAKLVSSEQQELAAVADLFAAQGNAAAEMEHARATWLWRTDPDRFATPDDFINFAWTDADMAAWLDASADNAALQTRVDSLAEDVANHPDLDDYITFINIDRQDNPFHELAEKLAVALDADHANLAACF